MIFKKISWFFKRHPFLYVARFKLLSRNSSVDEINSQNYNKTNQKKDIPDYFNSVNDTIFNGNQFTSPFENVKHLSVWLQNNIKGGPGLSEASDDALRIMLSGKGGVCSDMAQIFNNFCVINDIKVREWGNTRAPFDRSYGGHSFNEVFVEKLNKWVLIDVSSSLVFYHNEQLLSVIELYDLVRNKEKVSFKTFNANKNLDEKNIERNYLNPNIIPFLICNYSNKFYDSCLKFFRPYIPVFLVHFIIFVLGKSYHYKFPIDDYKKIFK